jgi:hypothetical protein
MADREIIAATLAAAILNGRNVSHDEDGAARAVEFYRQVLVALASTSRMPSVAPPAENLVQASTRRRQV